MEQYWNRGLVGVIGTTSAFGLQELSIVMSIVAATATFVFMILSAIKVWMEIKDRNK